MSSFQSIQKTSENDSRLTIQRALEIGQEDDEYEKEANSVADKVMKMPDPSASIQKMHDDEEEKMTEGGNKVQMMVDSPLKISKMSEGNASGLKASEQVEKGINESKGSGQSLPFDVQRDLGSKMGTDLSGISIHTDSNAVTMNKEIGAKAFTHGNDIYFNQGQYNTSTYQGKHLLTHELTHTLQQKGHSISRKILLKRLRDFVSIKQEDLNLTNTDIENTNEYKAYINPDLVWQKELKLTTDEARLACLLILNDMREGEGVDWQLEARKYALMARDRLNQRGPGIEGPERLNTEISVVTETRAQELFNQMATLTFYNDKDEETPVPFHYPADGCYARAHLMAERLTAMGYASNKKFVMSTKMGGLTVESNYSEDAPIGQQATTTWWYHVAPLVQVKKEDQTIVDMVIDPSLSDHPLTVDEWTGLMRGDSFTEMPLDDIRDYVSNNSGYPVDENITYSADRSTFSPYEFYESEDKPHEEAKMNSVRSRISDYARQAPAHELAYLIRHEIKKGTGKIDMTAIISKIKSLDSSQKSYFKLSFPNLLSELNSVLTKPEMDSITDELDK